MIFVVSSQCKVKCTVLVHRWKPKVQKNHWSVSFSRGRRKEAFSGEICPQGLQPCWFLRGGELFLFWKETAAETKTAKFWKNFQAHLKNLCIYSCLIDVLYIWLPIPCKMRRPLLLSWNDPRSSKCYVNCFLKINYGFCFVFVRS